MTSRTHVFAVAVENYLSLKVTPVAHAENDALKFVKAWQELGADPADCTILVSHQATQASLRSHFKKFVNGIDKGDTVVFFLPGMGSHSATQAISPRTIRFLET